VRWRRVMASVTLSAIAHLAVLLWWSSSKSPPPAIAAPPPSNEVVFEVARSVPALRKTVVVVVGPTRAAAGGSPRGRDRGRVRAVPTHSPSASPTAPPAPPPTFAATAVEPQTERGPSVPTSTVTRAATARTDGPSLEKFEELIRAQGELLAAGRGTGPGGFGDCTSRGCPSVVLALDLSGRHVSSSRVSVAPVVVHQPMLRCDLPLGRRRAVVRLLVMRDGIAAAPRLIESSGHVAFDSCAVRYVTSLGFAPGTDRAGNPLDVWINMGISGSFGAGS
jgi:hypothetical protein